MFIEIRQSLRQLRKSPGFTVTVVLTLALGIGANTAIFTLVHGIMLRSLPVSDPSLLYRIGDTDNCCVEGGFQADDGDFDIFSYDLYEHFKKSAPEFDQLAAVQAGIWQWSFRRGDAPAKSLHAEFVTGNYFSMLGINAYSGRMLNDSDDTPSATPVTVMSYATWQGEYSSDPTLIGSTIYIQTKPFTVVGITPPGFYGDRIADTPPEFWMPVHTEPYVRGAGSILSHGDSGWLYPIGRVHPGTNIGQLQTKLSIALRQWLSTRPVFTDNGGAAIIPKQHVVVVTAGGGIQAMQYETGKGLKMLMILSCVVLLIACANIANLMLARATTQRADVAVRIALGASRRRVIRQIMIESILLSIIGGLVGLAVAYAGSHAILTMAFPEAKNMPVNASPSWPILGFAFLVSLVTGVLFGTAPAWLSSHAQPAEVLRGVNRTTHDRSTLPQKALVIFQSALSLVLLAGAILMTKSLINAQHQDFGVATSNRYVLHFDPIGAGYTTERLPALYRQIENRFSSLPGVTNMSLSMYSPLEGDNWGECVIQQGHPAPGPDSHCGSTWDRVSNHFLDSVGVPILRGRGFTEQDTATSPQVVLVNETFVKRFFPDQDPIGKHFGIDLVQYSGTWEIVGVFKDFKMNNPREPIHSVFLRPITQQFTGYKEPSMIATEMQSMNMNAMILTFNQPQTNADTLIRRTLADIDPNLTVTNLRTFDNQVAGNFTQERLIAQLSSLFGILALILASVGLYGVMSYFVARRTTEIGVRMALGATRRSVVILVMRGVLWQILIGLLLGIPASLYAGYLMKSLLYGVGSYDPIALVGAPFMLVLCATLAGFIPARRAASIEPMRALRSE